MKPHEETWTAGTGRAGRFVFDREGNGVWYFSIVDPANDTSRAELAAQAPAMARLLLKVLENEYTGTSGYVGLGKQIDSLLRAAGVLP